MGVLDLPARLAGSRVAVAGGAPAHHMPPPRASYKEVADWLIARCFTSAARYLSCRGCCSRASGPLPAHWLGWQKHGPGGPRSTTRGARTVAGRAGTDNGFRHRLGKVSSAPRRLSSKARAQPPRTQPFPPALRAMCSLSGPLCTLAGAGSVWPCKEDWDSANVQAV